MCLGLIVLFREKVNHQGIVARWLSDNCFSAYLFHTPLLIALTLAMRRLSAPKPLKLAGASVLRCQSAGFSRLVPAPASSLPRAPSMRQDRRQL
jgi:hypothetical protein